MYFRHKRYMNERCYTDILKNVFFRNIHSSRCYSLQSYSIVVTEQLQILPVNMCFMRMSPLKFRKVTCKQFPAGFTLLPEFSLSMHPKPLYCLSVNVRM